MDRFFFSRRELKPPSMYRDKIALLSEEIYQNRAKFQQYQQFDFPQLLKRTSSLHITPVLQGDYELKQIRQEIQLAKNDRVWREEKRRGEEGREFSKM